MKCWRIDGGDWSDLIFADTRGKAKVEAVSQFELEFIDVRLARVPQGDDREAEYSTDRLYVECGVQERCHRCGHLLDADGCQWCEGQMAFDEWGTKGVGRRREGDMPLVANVLFHKTPCCGDDFSVEYPRDMEFNGEWVDNVVCRTCQVRYEIVLSNFREGSAKRLRWYPAPKGEGAAK